MRIFLTIFIILFIFIAVFIYVTELKITNVAEFVNEKNDYKIIFQEIGEPEWPFGDAKVKVTLVNSNYDKIESFEGYINNDGAFAQKENIKVNWHDDYVEIILKGGEQKDDVHLLEYRLFDDMLR